MKKLLTAVLLITGMVMASPSTGFACPKMKQECSKCKASAMKDQTVQLKHKVMSLGMHQEAFGITEEQMSKIKDIKHKAVKELIQLDADKEIVMVDLNSAMKAESIDVNVVNKLIDTKFAAKTKSAKVYAKAISDIQMILTKEQRVQWNQMFGQSKWGKEKCAKCAASDGKICPITGKPLNAKSPSKDSMK